MSYLPNGLRWPLVIVDNPGLLEFSKFITEVLGGIIMHVPGAAKICGDISRITAELRASLKALIQISCHYYCITTDIRTSRRAQVTWHLLSTMWMKVS
ncbi:LOW QUALITY PROTEIN: hypothetical protein PHMEG_00010025 [Phytophthora megakarya]|uniref:Uncharacterized protein n=1 Tax=Phytophthora megakarya TaxID=4795 RepID=A0A225WFA6_9STRA|nr:LOW QUALITY PROTEIN: hypothetical protein PHMEG_00010025 [Phytophthora megakarya]